MHRYLDQVVALGTESAQMRRLWVEVAHMLRPGTTLLRPPVLLRVLRRSLRPRTGRATLNQTRKDQGTFPLAQAFTPGTADE
jgi:hypothetical protein